MKISSLINDLKTWNDIPVDEDNTCDTVKSGSVDKEVHKVAIAMFGTIEVIKQVVDWGADFLIVHEPLFYDHMDDIHDLAIVKEKQRIIYDSGLTIFRFHDYAHAMNPDMICAGEIKYACLEGVIKERKKFGVTTFILKEPLTAEELAEKLIRNLNLDQIRVSGSINETVLPVALALRVICLNYTKTMILLLREKSVNGGMLKWPETLLQLVYIRLFLRWDTRPLNGQE